MNHKYNYQWKLSQLPVPTRGKVFSCFACGGGSSMGYKLAGFDVVGCNEIDPRCGMSVPPVMIANIANVIWEQWLCRMNKK